MAVLTVRKQYPTPPGTITPSIVCDGETGRAVADVAVMTFVQLIWWAWKIWWALKS